MLDYKGALELLFKLFAKWGCPMTQRYLQSNPGNKANILYIIVIVGSQISCQGKNGHVLLFPSPIFSPLGLSAGFLVRFKLAATDL